MSGQAPSDRDQITYLTYDDRAVSQSAIDRALQEVETRRQRRQRLLSIRTWALAVLLVLMLLAVCAALLWWRLTTPF
jgi:predicted nucleic acid-binding Zn ribbon protein